jgi:hypothetical protein
MPERSPAANGRPTKRVMVSDEPVSVLASASCPTVTDPGNSSAARVFIGLEQRSELENTPCK